MFGVLSVGAGSFLDLDWHLFLPLRLKSLFVKGLGEVIWSEVVVEMKNYDLSVFQSDLLSFYSSPAEYDPTTIGLLMNQVSFIHIPKICSQVVLV